MLSHLKRILTSGISPPRSVRRAGPKQPARRGLRLEHLEDRVTPAAAFPEFVDPNPAPGNEFGIQVVPLSTGNVVITSPRDDAGGTDAGAVYLFNGSTGALISTLRGSTTGDLFSASVRALPNGNFLITVPTWDNGAAVDAGAVVFGNGTTGVTGTISAANSLVGSTAGDQVGGTGLLVLSSGNYVVRSVNWDNGAAANAGAVTWGSGTTGVTGAVSAANSLVGSSTNDQVGATGLAALSNGNYVLRSANWDHGSAVDAGAVTWGSGTAGVAGVVSAANSLVGSTSGDLVGGSLLALSSGNYVVSSVNWDHGSAVDAGAVTWGDGTTGVTGVVSAANSLVGSATGDGVGTSLVSLSNGNYVVRSINWDNGAVMNAGAMTWGSGTAGVTGVVSAANSLVGSSFFDQVGSGSLTPLANGNYVVRSPNWDNGAVVNAGAATWGDGTTGVTGVVSAANSLVGSTANDQVGSLGITPLANGNYVVTSPNWDNGGGTDAGAATWADGTVGITGAVSAANSLVGSSAGDNVGSSGLTVLSNGNFVVRSPNWDNGAAANAGAVTWADGTAGVTGPISAANSLVGSSAGDNVGGGSVVALSSGNYVVTSPNWDNGAAANAGAATWGSGTAGVTGAVSAANSLVGSTSGDQVGGGTAISSMGFSSVVGGVTVLANGNYVVRSPFWDNGAAADAGAVTWGSGTAGVTGAVSAANSLVGSSAGDQIAGGVITTGFIPGIQGGVTALSNGNYVVRSPFWDNGAAADAGAVTWGSGTAGVAGVVSAANSLVGSSAGDQVGGGGATSTFFPTPAGGVTVLANGNYVVRSPVWDNGGAADAGAATFGSGTAGVAGAVSAANSLVGSTAGDLVGRTVSALSSGNYVVTSPNWDNGPVWNAGATTFGNGTTGVWGPVTAVNSAIGPVENAALQGVLVDNVNGTFYSFFYAGAVGGRLLVGSQTTGYFPNITAPATPTAYEDVDQSITGVRIADAGGVVLTFTLSVGHGTLTLGTTTNLTVAGNGTASVTLTGTTADLNAALATLVYRGALNFSGVDTLTLAADDGFGSGLSTSSAITVKSAAEQAADLQARVAALRDAGVLNGGQANSLIVKLNLQGNAGDGGKVQAFLNQVQALRSAGILTAEQAAELLYWGQILLLSVSRR